MQHTQNGEEGQVERNADDQAAIAEVELEQAIIGLENGKLKITETEEIGRTTSSLMDYKKSQFIRYWSVILINLFSFISKSINFIS
jgi:hypothetical protein